MSVSLTPIESKQVGIVGLGAEGARVVAELDIPSSWEVDCQIWDCCQDSLSSVSSQANFEKKIIGVCISHGLGCVGQYELGRSIFLQDQDICREWLVGKDLVILVGSLSGGFSGGFAPEFARLCKNMGISCLMYAKLPFSFEGRKRIETSKQTLAKLRELCIAVPVFEGDDYLEYMDDAGFAKNAVKASTVDCALAVKTLVRLIVKDGLYDFDLSTLQSAFDLDVSKTLVISAASESDDTIESVLDQLISRIDRKLPDREMNIDRLLVSVSGGKSLPMNDVSRINRTVVDRFHNPGKAFFGACMDEREKGISVVVFLSIHLGKQFELQDLSSSHSKKHQAVHTKSAKKKVRPRKVDHKSANVKSDDSPQEFFDSILSESNRGYFDDTPSNSWNGIDLDVPTYIRRGIRIKT